MGNLEQSHSVGLTFPAVIETFDVKNSIHTVSLSKAGGEKGRGGRSVSTHFPPAPPLQPVKL